MRGPSIVTCVTRQRAYCKNSGDVYTMAVLVSARGHVTDCRAWWSGRPISGTGRATWGVVRRGMRRQSVAGECAAATVINVISTRKLGPFRRPAQILTPVATQHFSLFIYTRLDYTGSPLTYGQNDCRVARPVQTVALTLPPPLSPYHPSS